MIVMLTVREQLNRRQGTDNITRNFLRWAGGNTLWESSLIFFITLSDASKYDIIWTEHSDVIDSFVSEILMYKSWHERSWTERFTS